jgi:hypothetical protein
MRILSERKSSSSYFELGTNPDLAAREHARRRQIVSGILVVIVLFELVNFPGAIIMRSFIAIGTILLSLALCGVAILFNQLGKVTVVSLLLILVVDLGCTFTLLMFPRGLDVGELPVFDVLLVSELIAVSLLPTLMVFPVAISNILFIITIIAFQPHTRELNMLLASNAGYNAVIQPVSLQIIVAAVLYLWVRSALQAIARADRAEEIALLQRREAELLRREAERTRQLDQGSEHLLQVLVRAANGDRTVRAALTQDNVLWRVGNALNLLLARLRRAGLVEFENQQLREANARLSQIAHPGPQYTPHTPHTPHTPLPQSSLTRES